MGWNDARRSTLWAFLACASWLAPFHGSAASESEPAVFLVPERRLDAPEARQGVTSDGQSVYAIDNSTIAKYDLATGERIARFEGDPERFVHLNSCTIAQGELVCAASNYPATPHRGQIEFFDPATLAHLRTVTMPENPGSLTIVARDGERWWAVYANYDGRGGVPGQDHRATVLAELDGEFRIVRRFTFPPSVLGRVAPRSVSGASWGADGRLYVSGHDKPEIYALELPQSGSVLQHAATYSVASFGQAVDFDPRDRGLLWSIDRGTRTIIASRVAPAGEQ